MKAGFLTELDARLLEGDKVWKLIAPLVYYSELLDCEITVPRRFCTDLSSVPRVPVAYWFWGGKAHREGVLHDYLYRIDSQPVVSRGLANAVFLEAMISRGKSRFVRNPMYWGVCIGGGPSYHKKYVLERIK